MSEISDTHGQSSRIALVTGAGSGIGRAVTLALLADGWSVAVAGRRHEPLEETVALAPGDAASRIMVHPTDVSDPASVDALFAALTARFGRLDLLFNNAGISAAASPDELSFEQWSQVVGINLTGSFLCAQGAFRAMRHQNPMGGRIINNGSISAHAPRPNSIAYTATKHAITGLTKSLSLDGRPYNIACGQIDIGNALTPMAARMQSGVLQANGTIAPEPVMHVDDVARTVLFMASMPLDTNVQTLTVMATTMPFIGRG
jgi:NAD(P)-dependent dehydrogenase (short-subunit alcohol dehydrogenase family)